MSSSVYVVLQTISGDTAVEDGTILDAGCACFTGYDSAVAGAKRSAIGASLAVYRTDVRLWRSETRWLRPGEQRGTPGSAAGAVLATKRACRLLQKVWEAGLPDFVIGEPGRLALIPRPLVPAFAESILSGCPEGGLDQSRHPVLYAIVSALAWFPPDDLPSVAVTNWAYDAIGVEIGRPLLHEELGPGDALSVIPFDREEDAHSVMRDPEVAESTNEGNCWLDMRSVFPPAAVAGSEVSK